MKRTLLMAGLLFLLNNAFAADLESSVTEASYGASDGEIDLTVLGGAAPYQYSWVGPGGFSSTEEDVSGLLPGTYTVTVIDAFCGVATLTISVGEGEKEGEDTAIIVEELNGMNISIYPNPTKGVVYFKSETPLDIELYTVLGEVVMEKKGIHEIDLSRYPRGIYLLQLKASDMVLTKKIILQ